MFLSKPNPAKKKIEDELASLRKQLAEKENELADLKRQQADDQRTTDKPLTNEEISRYSRQMILPGFGGVQAQVKLKNSSFLIVGMGGLGCPAAQYLAAAGAGTIGIVDYDEVESTNLHRQILHTEADLDRPKVESAKNALQKLNSAVKVVSYRMHLGNENAPELVDQYDVIMDCSDNVPTRYLLNDVCVMKGKPLVSGSALQFDGQLTVYNWEGGPCYRCLFPVPPPPETVTNCGDGGVLGAITGTIGSLQALEAIKICLGLGDVLAGRMLLFDGVKCVFRNIRLRAKRKECNVCSDTPFVTRLINYEDFCGLRSSDKDFTLTLLHESLRLSIRDYVKIKKCPHLLVDVRSPVEFDMCRLDDSVNIPLKSILDDSRISEIREKTEDKKPLIVICRRGNDSQIAVQHLIKKLPDIKVRDISGGLYAWHYCVDADFPIY